MNNFSPTQWVMFPMASLMLGMMAMTLVTSYQLLPAPEDADAVVTSISAGHRHFDQQGVSTAPVWDSRPDTF